MHNFPSTFETLERIMAGLKKQIPSESLQSQLLSIHQLIEELNQSGRITVAQFRLLQDRLWKKHFEKYELLRIARERPCA